MARRIDTRDGSPHTCSTIIEIPQEGTRRQRSVTEGEESLVSLDDVDADEKQDLSSSLSEIEQELTNGMEKLCCDDKRASGPAGTSGGNMGRKAYRRTRSLYGASPNCQFGPKASLMTSQANTLTIQDPGSQRLTWYKPPQTILLIKKVFDDVVIQPYLDLLTWLIKEKAMMVFVEAPVFTDPLLQNNAMFQQVKDKVFTFKEGTDDLKDKVDLIICLGGDGTLLHASSLFQQSMPPVMSFHLGSLGFLSPFQFANFNVKVSQVLEGNVPLCLRTRLKAAFCALGSDCEKRDFKNVERKENIMVLNEVVVDRGPSPYLCNVDLYIEHKYITSVQGDGLIIATATGSTAYAAAAGASMVHPNVPAILITPICPHSLSFRPIVVPAGVEIKVMVSPDARNSAWASFDGRSRKEICKGDTLRISTSIFPLPQVCNEDQMSDWFESLSSCLHWNVRKQQRAFMSHSHTPSLDSLPGSSDSDGVNGHSSTHGAR